MKMPFADFHSDTLTVMSEKGADLFENGLNFDAKFAQNLDEFLQVFAIFLPENLSEKEAKEYYQRNIDYFHNQLNRFSDKVILVKKREDLKKKGKIKILLSIENFSFAAEEEIKKVYEDGVRIASLTWNSDNAFAGGALGSGQISENGKKIIRKMEEIGITLDLSHLNPKSIDDALKIAKKPVLATHSSSLSIHKNPRNLSDESYLEIVRRGGVAGVNFHKDFIGPNFDAAAVARHIEHYYKLDENGVVFGSDFDGADMPNDIRGLRDIGLIFSEIENLGIPIEKLYENAIQFLEKIL